MKVSRKSKKVFNDINITPLTDIFLVLLTIMMIMAPLMRQMRADISLPQIISGTEMQQDEARVDINAAGEFFLNDKLIAESDLDAALKEKATTVSVKRLVVQADVNTKSRAVLRVFRAAEEAPFDKVTVVGEVLESQPTQDEN